jgi:outer membrane protein TolC
MKRSGVLCTTAAAMLLLPVRTSAQQDLPVRVTLEEAQSRAVETSHRLAEIRARGAAAQDAVRIRIAASRPTVAAAAGYTRTNHVDEFSFPGPTGAPRVLYPDVPDNYRARVELQWPIYNGGRTDALERAAQAEASALTADAGVLQVDLRFEAARAFWALVTARETVTVLEQGVDRAQAHVRDARERLIAGLIPPNEVASAEAQESRHRMLLIEARAQRDIATADLARVIGVEVGQPIEPLAVLETASGGSSIPDPGSPIPSAFSSVIPSALNAALDAARLSRNERVAIERRIEAADAQLDVAGAGKRPVVAVTSGYDLARPNPHIFPRAGEWNDSWDASVNVSWPLWDGGRTRAEVAQATNLVQAVRRRLAEFDSVLQVEVRQRALEIESGRAAVEAAADAVRAADEARRVVSERYRVGVASNTELLDADFALLQAGLDRTRALAGVRLAEARLQRALGR